MAVFDVSFLNPKLKRSGGGSSYGTLVDQLSIKENQLSVDGKLSQGDYDSLLLDAQKLYNFAGLTTDQRSNIAVKISEYQKGKSTSRLKDTSDIDRLNREVGDDFRKNSLLFASSPQTLLKANSDALQAKLERLTDSIDALEGAGSDATSHINEFNDTLNRYNDTLSALSDMETYQPGSGAPKSNYVAYLTTNARGELTNVEFDRPGKSGFVETNGVYGGLQVYGKVNRKELGKNVFQLGDTVFSASDYAIPDPQNPGALRYNPLTATDTQKRIGSGTSFSQAGVYKEIDPKSVRSQGAIPAGGWAEGEKGALYRRGEDGRYTKYININRENLGISDNDILRVPRVLESSINQDVFQTIDGAAMPAPKSYPADFIGPIPQGSTRASAAAPAAASKIDYAPDAARQTVATSRTSAPTERTPQTSPGIASRTIGAAKSYLGQLFG